MSESLVESQPGNGRNWLHILLGPAIFLAVQLLPFFGPPNARVGFGILFWMVYWWVTVAVDIKVTCLVPVFVVAFYEYMPIAKVMQAYIDKEFLLILGTSIVTVAWARWGFARRIALHFLLRFGNDTRKQMIGWFLLTSFVSFIMGNTAVAAIFAPVAVAALIYAGFETFEQRWNSNAASNVLIAVAWGASLGGMATPLGGGQAVVTLGMLQKYIGHEVYLLDWAVRMIPVSLLVIAAMSAFMWLFMKPEVETFKGGREFYRKELDAMGPFSYEEKVACYGFLLIVATALLRPAYVDLVKGPLFAWLEPGRMFFILAIGLFFMPSRRQKGENIVSISSLAKHFPLAILFIWPASMALGQILNQTGASAMIGQWLGSMFASGGDISAIVAFSLGGNALSQVTSDTAAAGVMIPMAIETFKHWGGMEYGAVPFIWAVGAAISWSYAVASSTGAQGIVAGFGANLKRMFVYGMIGALISVAVSTLYFIFFIAVLKSDFYLLPPGL
ncbi:SLC13 family permease [Desulfocurvibacter africanus]|uniref:SLC13 family permease n=1 Tax=Desulfocurvibacter africanus TaxID=873 RepID=UPI002FDB0C15